MVDLKCIARKHFHTRHPHICLSFVFCSAHLDLEAWQLSHLFPVTSHQNRHTYVNTALPLTGNISAVKFSHFNDHSASDSMRQIDKWQHTTMAIAKCGGIARFTWCNSRSAELSWKSTSSSGTQWPVGTPLILQAELNASNTIIWATISPRGSWPSPIYKALCSAGTKSFTNSWEQPWPI